MDIKSTIKPTGIENVWEITLDAFEDFRGRFIELFDSRKHIINFVEDDISVSKRGVLRGIHGDETTWKLVTCVHGSFYVVVVNCDEKSEQYLRWQEFTLSGTNGRQLLVSPKRGLAILALEDDSVFHYKQSAHYGGMERQFTFKWDDPRIGIRWPMKDPIMSERDASKTMLLRFPEEDMKKLEEHLLPAMKKLSELPEDIALGAAKVIDEAIDIALKQKEACSSPPDTSCIKLQKKPKKRMRGRPRGKK